MVDQSRPLPLPPDLAERTARLFAEGDVLLQAQQWERAFDAFKRGYEELLRAQPPDARFHKGTPLHNMGLSSWLGGNPAGAVRYTLLSFLEDALSRAAETPDELTELTMPAARNLVSAFSIPLGHVTGIAQRVRELVRDGRLFRDPEVLARELGLNHLLDSGEEIPQPRKRLAGTYTSTWDRRVFVGGSYKGQLLEINEIAATIRSRSFDPVVEFEFEIAPEQIHHHALMLLHECRWAVFDVTTEAGQLMELERTRDYQIRPLVVQQGTSQHGSMSAMVETLLARLGQPASRYSRMDELRNLVDGYLDSAEAELLREAS